MTQLAVTTPAIISPDPFSPRLERLDVAEGSSIVSLLLLAVKTDRLAFDDLERVAVYVDGVDLERALGEDPDLVGSAREAMLDFIPPAGAILNITVEPLGGGGNGGGNKALQTVLTIAVVALSFWVGSGAATPALLDKLIIRTALAAAVNVAGQMAIAAAFKPGTDGLGEANDRRALQGQSNEFRPRKPFPLQLGAEVVAADLAANPYTQNIGQDVWLYVALAWHYGPCVLDQIKIGETLLGDYPAADIQVEHFLSPGPRSSYLYPGRVVQSNFSDQLDFAGGGVWEVHTAAVSSERIEVDITLPNGLRYAADSGKQRNEEIAGQIQFAEVGTENWLPATFPGSTTARTKTNQALPAGSFYLNLRTVDAVRRTFGWEVPDKAKQWKVRVRAWDPDGDFPDDGSRTWATYWTAIRSIERKAPVTDQNLAVTFMRIRSSDDLNGALPTVTAKVTPIFPVWKNGNWNTEEPTSNEAAAARWLLTGPAAAKPMRADQIDGSIVDAFNLIEANGWGAGVQVREEASQRDVLIRLGRAGRFATYWNGRRLCFVPEWEKVAPRQIFTGRNAQGYRYRRAFPEPCHAVIVEFSRVEDASVADEVFVYADGYNADNAELFETVRLDFSCTIERAFKEGRSYLAKRTLQVEVHEWTAGADAIATTFGDRVLVRHMSTLFGIADGRVDRRLWAGALVSGIRLDEPVTMEEGETYAIDLRRADEVIRGVPIVTTPGETRNLMFAAPRAVDVSPEKGDLVVFGKTGLVTEDVEIVDVEKDGDLSASFRAVRYIGPELMAAETGPIPPLVSGLTPRAVAPKPRILGANGSPDGVVVSFDVDPVRGSYLDGFTARWRRTAEEGEPVNPWNTLPAVGGAAREVRTPPISDAASNDGDVEAEYRVDVEIRSVLRNGSISDPAVAPGVLVRKGVAPPRGFIAEGLVRVAEDESSYPVISIKAIVIEAGAVQDLVVELLDTLDPDPESGWYAGATFPAANPLGDVRNVSPGGIYNVRAYWRTADNWKSIAVVRWAVKVPENSNVAGDVSPTAPTLKPLFDGLGAIPVILEEQWKNARNILSEVVGRREIDRVGREASIERDQYIQDDLVQTRETLEIADETAFLLIETTKSLVLSELAAETATRTLQVSAINDNVAVIDTRTNTLATDLIAETTTRETQISTVNGNLATVDTIARTAASDVLSVASTVSTLTSNFGDFQAVASNQIQTLTNGQSALSTSLSLLGATVNGNGSAISGLQTALATETSTRASQDTALQSSFNGQLALVNSSLTTLAQADQTQAGLITGLQATYDGLNSTVQIQATAISGLNTQNNVAKLTLVAQAAGGNPARFAITSTLYGNDIALDADKVWFGGSMFFEPFTRTLQTLAVGGQRRVIGAGFGAGGDLDEWRGSAGVAVGSMTIANSVWAVKSSDGKTYYGGAELGSGGSSLAATASPSELAQGSTPGAGYKTTNLLTINITGPGSDAAVIRYLKSDEVGGTVDIYPTGRQVYFGAAVPGGGFVRAIILAVITSGGKSVNLVLDAQLSDST